MLVEDTNSSSAAKEQERKERREEGSGDLKSLESVSKYFTRSAGLKRYPFKKSTTKFRLSLARKLPVMFMEIKFEH